MAFSEDVLKRYEAYGWHVQYVDSGEDVAALEKALAKAKAETDRPSFIAVRTIIGWPAPTKQNTGKAHGSALGADEIAKTKEILGFNPEVSFAVDPTGDRAHPRTGRPGPGRAHRVAAELRRSGRRRTRPAKALFDRLVTRTLPTGWTDALPSFPTDKDGKPNAIATRAASGKVLSALRRCCRNCGAARPTWPRATTPPWTASRASCRPTGRPRCGPAARTGARCTSASASTRWVRS